jgi:hypothetical protein
LAVGHGEGGGLARRAEDAEPVTALLQEGVGLADVALYADRPIGLDGCGDGGVDAMVGT